MLRSRAPLCSNVPQVRQTATAWAPARSSCQLATASHRETIERAPPFATLTGGGSQALSRPDVLILPLSSGFSVSSQRHQVEPGAISITRAAIYVRLPPRINGHRLPDVWPAPVPWRWTSGRARAKSFESLRRARINPVVQMVILECNAQELDLRLGGRDPRVGNAAENLRRDEAGEQSNDDQHNDELDECKTRRCVARAPTAPRSITRREFHLSSQDLSVDAVDSLQHRQCHEPHEQPEQKDQGRLDQPDEGAQPPRGLTVVAVRCTKTELVELSTLLSHCYELLGKRGQHAVKLSSEALASGDSAGRAVDRLTDRNVGNGRARDAQRGNEADTAFQQQSQCSCESRRRIIALELARHRKRQSRSVPGTAMIGRRKPPSHRENEEHEQRDPQERPSHYGIAHSHQYSCGERERSADVAQHRSEARHDEQ